MKNLSFCKKDTRKKYEIFTILIQLSRVRDDMMCGLKSGHFFKQKEKEKELKFKNLLCN